MKLGVSNKIRETISENGIYKAKVAGITPYEGATYGDMLIIDFLVDDHGTARHVDGVAALHKVITPKSKLYTWFSAILGEDIGKIDNIDTNQIIGKECKVSVVNKDNNGYVNSKVMKVYSKNQNTLDEVPF